MSGAMALELLLEEAGLPYERVAVDMASGEHKTPEYLALNPTGQVPALALPSGEVIGESAAIILTIGERHPDQDLVPKFGDPNRPRFLRWLIYMAASPYMTYVQFNHPERFIGDEAAQVALIENARTRLLGQFDVLDAAITNAPYFLSDSPSALDFYLYMLIEFFGDVDAVLDGRDRLEQLYSVVSKRDSVRRIRPSHG